jgi:hypothetical protein
MLMAAVPGALASTRLPCAGRGEIKHRRLVQWSHDGSCGGAAQRAAHVSSACGAVEAFRLFRPKFTEN